MARLGACICVMAATAGATAGQDWSGAYAGVHLGGAYADFTNRLPAVSGPRGNDASLLGGVQLGYNWQSGNTVYGAEADYSRMRLRASSVGGNFTEDSMASIRMRAGQVMGRTLVYGSLGVAWTERKTAIAGAGSSTDFEPGLMAGAGAERWLGNNVTGRFEAFYVDAPRSERTVGGVATSGGSRNVVYRFGLNLHF
ncbi:outer membrane protein [Roseovarius spongiae]|nr:outer membrane beta-barrel protein [Roseovarius spongiae]